MQQNIYHDNRLAFRKLSTLCLQSQKAPSPSPTQYHFYISYYCSYTNCENNMGTFLVLESSAIGSQEDLDHVWLI